MLMKGEIKMNEKTKFVIPEGIREFIFRYRFQNFLRENQKPHSGNVFERLEQAVIEDPDLEKRFEEFIVNEVSNGKNRQIFWCDFSVESLSILGDISKIKSRLQNHNLPTENFNNLLKAEAPELGEMVYLNILEGNGQTPDKISLSFMYEYPIETEAEDGITSQTIHDYIWVDVFPHQQYLQIKTRPYTNQYLANLHHSNKVFDYYHLYLKNLFNISYLNMEESKGILFNIFKVLTNRAEEDYRVRIDIVENSIIEKTKELASLIDLSNIKYPVDLANRISRLLERSLILNDLDNYMAYDPEKLGIVDRIDFSDQSGAKVNALSQEEGIEIADIYFDTRETLDEIKQLNKLWIRWFLRNPSDNPNETQHIETKFEVYNDRMIILFLGVQSAPKEVQNHVLSLFRKFKEGEIS